MRKNLNPFVYMFIVKFLVFPNNSMRVYPIKLKIGMLYQINDTFGNAVFFRCVFNKNFPFFFLFQETFEN